MATFIIIARVRGGDVYEMPVVAKSRWCATLRFCQCFGLRPSQLVFCQE